MVMLAVIAMFVAEVAAFVAVGEHIGFGWAVLLLLGVSALGPAVIRRTGLGVLTRAQSRLAEGALPTREILDGVLVLIGGVMICVPGFVSDFLGLLLMLGPVRHAAIRLGGRRLGGRVARFQGPGRGVVTVRSRPVGRRPPAPPERPGPELYPGPDPGPDPDPGPGPRPGGPPPEPS